MPDLIERPHEFVNVCRSKYPAYALIVQICEWALVKPSGVYDATVRQIIDNQVDKFDLIGRERSPRHEFCKRLLRGLPVEADQRADE